MPKPIPYHRKPGRVAHIDDVMAECAVIGGTASGRYRRRDEQPSIEQMFAVFRAHAAAMTEAENQRLDSLKNWLGVTPSTSH